MTAFSRSVQPKNASSPMVLTLLGMSIAVSFLHPENAPSPMVSTLFGMTMDVSAVHDAKQLLPIIVQPSLMVILVSDEHSAKELLPIDVTFAPIVTEVRLVQPRKWSPYLKDALFTLRVVTLSGMTTSVSEVHP